ncbi:MAG: zinc metallopeptidase [Clostridia bacterium]|nr:zinc metallopeptidase [Clostridia bacterium]
MNSYYFILVIPALLFSLYAQYKVKSTFNKYSRVGNMRGMTGAEVARQILNSNGLYDVAVEPVAGSLTDHYDPRTKAVRLSETVYSSTSVAAIGVAAHETGHALQHRHGYSPMALRSSLVPVAGIGSSAGPYMAIFGLMFNWPVLTQLGIILFTAAVGFYLVTLPVEFNASSRAIGVLQHTGMLSAQALVSIKKVLSAAAMSYVASAAVAMAQLLHLVLSFMGSRGDE